MTPRIAVHTSATLAGLYTTLRPRGQGIRHRDGSSRIPAVPDREPGSGLQPARRSRPT